MYKKILVPLDGARTGGKAVDHAVEIARRFDAEVMLFRVVPPATMAATGMGAPGSVAMIELAAEAADIEEAAGLKRARNQINTRRRQLEQDGLKASAEVVVGSPVEQIKKYAKQQKVDLIVMSTRGRSGLTRAFLGSVADDVVRSGIAPVLLLRR